MNVGQNERGTALLTVLLLVAVMATVSATALDRIGIGTRLLANAGAISQNHAWLGITESLAETRIEDLLASDDAQTTLAGGWMGVARKIDLPDGGSAEMRVEDGGNCFNLNSLVERNASGRLVERPLAAKQFAALMVLLGISENEAIQIAASATDYIDTDGNPLPSGGEDGSHQGNGLSANQMMAHASEIRSVANVSARHYSLLRRWICALPVAELSALNVNTLVPEQAPLLAMLAPGRIDVAQARARIASRPAEGFGSVIKFWASPLLSGVAPEDEAAQQVKVRTSFFVIHAQVASKGVMVGEVALIDARAPRARIVRREMGEVG